MSIEVRSVKALTDNFIYLITEKNNNSVYVIDPSEAQPVLKLCKEEGLEIKAILTTHHHWDHVGGNLEIQKNTGCEIIGFEGDAHRIPGITRRVKEGETIKVGSAEAKVYFIPGHTLGHIAYYFEKDRALFCGDTLFSLGCGRLFEGTAGQMFQSLEILSGFPDDTRVFCAHEYTLSNARFLMALDPSSSQKKIYATLEARLKSEGATVPSTLAYEKEWNPFLKCKNPLEFAELRKQKDLWKDPL